MSTYQFKQFKAFHLQLVLAKWQQPWKTQSQLASDFGITDAWASQILTSPEAREIEAGLKDRSIDTMMDVQAQLQAIAPMALAERVQLAMDHNTPPAVREKSLAGILEMAGHTPTRRIQIERPSQLDARVAMSDAELRDDLLKTVSGPGRGPDGNLIN